MLVDFSAGAAAVWFSHPGPINCWQAKDYTLKNLGSIFFYGSASSGWACQGTELVGDVVRGISPLKDGVGGITPANSELSTRISRDTSRSSGRTLRV